MLHALLPFAKTNSAHRIVTERQKKSVLKEEEKKANKKSGETKWKMNMNRNDDCD